MRLVQFRSILRPIFSSLCILWPCLMVPLPVADLNLITLNLHLLKSSTDTARYFTAFFFNFVHPGGEFLI